jgi:hypothetical protein
MDKIDWYLLSSNENAIHILEKNKEWIDWSALSSNANAIPLLKKYKELIDYNIIYYNPNVFNLFKILEINKLDISNINTSKISNLFSNPNLYTIDYYNLKWKMYTGIGNELYGKMYAVKNIHKFKYWGVDGFDDYIEDDDELKQNHEWWNKKIDRI